MPALSPEQRKDDALLWRDSKPVPASELHARAAALLESLPDSRYCINLCERHGNFLVGFLAALRSGRTTLLPLNRGSDTLHSLARQYDEPAVLTDQTIEALPGVPDRERSAGAAQRADLTEGVAPHQVAAIVFTSGSTGAPQGHPKQWADIAAIARATRERLLEDIGGCTLVATVPCQHNYGFETSILLTLAAGCAVEDERPFFPLDIAAALARVPEPRVLITTPAHLRACVAAAVQLPALRLIVSATAPLDPHLARQAESAWRVPVREIYGCTEAGTMAVRRTLDGEHWLPLRGGEMRILDGSAAFQAPWLAQPVPLQDLIAPEADGRFRLLGRTADLVKVAGKRASLADLTQQLLALPGVEDAVVFQPQEGGRCAALVVAPTSTREALIGALAARVDAAFLPRPLRLVTRLPRNDAGKLPREALLAAVAAREPPE